MRNKYVLLLILQLIVLNCLGGCLHIGEVQKQTGYHEPIKELEEYVLPSMGEYIAFRKPKVDDDSQTVYIRTVFLTDYIDDDQLKEQYSPLLVMEDTRCLINEYMSGDDFFQGYKIVVSFAERTGDYYEGYGEVRNYSYSQGNIKDSLCVVDYNRLLDSKTVDSINCSGIKQINLSDFSEDEVEEILSIIAQLPDLEVVLLDEQLEDELEQSSVELKLDLIFV